VPPLPGRREYNPIIRYSPQKRRTRDTKVAY
jgi:hypothetical protein